jgi:RHS repeat-associated protein
MQNTASPLLAPIKPETVSGVVKIVTVSHRGFAANDARVHRGCSECSYDVASDEIDYNYFRYYDPKTGRYTQSDPIGLAGGINTYLYALANPLKYIDPFGLSPALSLCGGASALCRADPMTKDHFSENVTNEGFFWDSEGSYHEVSCTYSCKKDGFTENVRATHTEAYNYPQSKDDGREGVCLGADFGEGRWNHNNNSTLYSDPEYRFFDPVTSSSDGLRNWANGN